MNDRAVAEIRRANDLDPLYLMANAEIGWVAYFGRRFDEAAARLPPDAGDGSELPLRHELPSDDALALKKDPETIALAKKLLDVTSGDAYFLGQLGWAHGLLGNKEEARRILGQLQAMPATQPAPPPAIYYVYMGLGDRQGALEWMEKAYAGRWSDVVWIKAAPEYDWLRDDPRFQALLKKLKLDG